MPTVTATTPAAGGNLSPTAPGLSSAAAGGNLAPTDSGGSGAAAGGNLSPTAPGLSSSAAGGNLSPTAPGLSGAAAGGNLSPTAPGLTQAAYSSPSDQLVVPLSVGLPSAVSFEAVFSPELPSDGLLLTVPDRTENGRGVYTTTGTAGPLAEGQLSQDQTKPGIWCSSYYDGTVWRMDVWYEGELMAYWQSATTAFANPWSVPLWNFGGDPGDFPTAEWDVIVYNTFEIALADGGGVIVPTYSPSLPDDPLLYIGQIGNQPFFANGEPSWNGESWDGGDTLLQVSGMPDMWIFGELGSGPTWTTVAYYGATPPLGVTFYPTEGDAAGNVRMKRSNPDTPGLTTAAAGGNLSPSAPGAIS